MLKVLMMGGRRCGKTSVLTSMFYQAINGDLNNIFTLNNETAFQEKDGHWPDPAAEAGVRRHPGRQNNEGL